MNPVEIAHIVARWRELSAAETIRAQALLDDAWETLQELIPGIGDRVWSGQLRMGLVVAKVCEAVIPALRNPEGVLEEETGIDDYKRRWRRDSVTSTGLVVFSEDALKALRGVWGSSFEIIPAALP